MYVILIVAQGAVWLKVRWPLL